MTHTPSALPPGSGPTIRIPTANTLGKYAHLALQAEVQAVLDATDDQRFEALALAAFNLGQFVGSGSLEAGVATSAVRQAIQIVIDQMSATRSDMAVLTAGEFGRRCNLGINLTRQYVRSGRIKSVRYGRRIVIPLSEVDAFLERESKGDAA
jgi:excisionase family DNA binding protein